MRDRNTLYEAVTDIAAVFSTAVAELGWDAEVMTSDGPTSMACDHVAVWPQQITPTRQTTSPCVIITRVTFAIEVGFCLPEQEVETAAWWEDQAVDHHPILWALYAAVIDAITDGLLILNCVCSEVIPGPWALLSNDGGQTTWAGSIDVGLDLVNVGS